MHDLTRVRGARSTDVRAIARIHADSWQAAYRGVLPDTYLATLQPRRLELRWRGRLGGVRVVERGGVVLGFAVLGAARDRDVVGFAGEIFMLYVHPTVWRQGLGRALLEDARAVLAARGHRWLVVWVLTENRAARVAYGRCGLRPDGRRKVDDRTPGTPHVLRLAQPLRPAWQP